ncbi:MAG: paraquat-inducible protein B, partial [Gammaproteobacteria bacterium]|nr:paraquat-inducible protein B [Gammaproteobacteria bacterium]
TMQSAEQTMQQLSSMVQQFNALLGSEQVQQLPADLQQSLTSLQQVLAGFSPGAPVYDRLNGNLQALDQVMRELQPVLQTLNQQSNALVFDAEQSADPQPKRAKQ